MTDARAGADLVAVVRAKDPDTRVGLSLVEVLEHNTAPKLRLGVGMVSVLRQRLEDVNVDLRTGADLVGVLAHQAGISTLQVGGDFVAVIRRLHPGLENVDRRGILRVKMPDGTWKRMVPRAQM